MGGSGPSGPPTSCDIPGGGKTTGINDCGPDLEDCCTSLPVTGGMFLRNYDGVTFTDMTHPATVSTYRLDKYEVTVARFRRFVEAVVGSGAWRPPAGSGKHVHLNNGQGLAAVGGGYEPGWNTAWNDELFGTISEWTTAMMTCSADQGFNGWTESANGINDRKPIPCVGWHQAYAFCIWDGGFLPSDTEWNYAASGGNLHRVFPWGATIECDKLMSNELSCPAHGLPNHVGSFPLGNGFFGHSDLSGNLFEWSLDTFATALANPCTDCAQFASSVERTARGGSFVYGFEGDLFHAARRGKATAGNTYWDIGFRCARPPE